MLHNEMRISKEKKLTNRTITQMEEFLEKVEVHSDVEYFLNLDIDLPEEKAPIGVRIAKTISDSTTEMGEPFMGTPKQAKALKKAREIHESLFNMMEYLGNHSPSKFVLSCSEQFKVKGYLSKKQVEVLERIVSETLEDDNSPLDSLTELNIPETPPPKKQKR